MKQKKMYIPSDVGEFLDHLSSMLLGAPKFLDKTGYFPYRNLDYVFQQLTEGLSNIRQTLGEERYRELMRMSDRDPGAVRGRPGKRDGRGVEGPRNHPQDGGHRQTGPAKILKHRPPAPFRGFSAPTRNRARWSSFVRANSAETPHT